MSRRILNLSTVATCGRRLAVAEVRRLDALVADAKCVLREV